MAIKIIFIVFQSVPFHDGKTRPRFLQAILNAALFKGLIRQKRVPNFQKALHDCSYAGPCSDKHPKSPPLIRSLSSTPQYQVTQEIWLSFVPHRLIWRRLKTFLRPFLACLPCLKRESDLSPAHLAKRGPHLYLQLQAMLFSPRYWPCSRYLAKVGGCICKRTPSPITTPIIAPQGQACRCRQGPLLPARIQPLMRSLSSQTPICKLYLTQGTDTSSSPAPVLLASLFSLRTLRGPFFTGKSYLLYLPLHPRRNKSAGMARQEQAEAKFT